jgi:hypothetical protein
MRELIDLLIRSQVPHLIIGGHGLAVHGVERDTMDLDCMVAAPARAEMARFLEAHGFTEMARHDSFSRFRHRSLVYPLLDVMEVDAGTWAKMFPKGREGVLFERNVRVPSLLHYIALKLHAIRQNPTRERKDGQDIVDLLRAHAGTYSEDELRSIFTRYAPLGYWDTIRPALEK